MTTIPHLHYHTLPSTSDLAKSLGRLTGTHVFPEGLCISADVQTAGRGQFERKWVSPPGGVYFSFLSFSSISSRLRREEEKELKGLRWSQSAVEGFDPVALAKSPDPMGSKGREPLETSVLLPPLNKGESALRRNRSSADCKEEKERAEEACFVRDVGCPAGSAQKADPRRGSRGIFSAAEIPYLIGLQLQRWLSKNFQIDPHVKPPNDLLVNGKKLCGILVEKVSRGDASFWVVGIGLNLNQQVFPESLPDATSLSLLSGKTYDKYTIIEGLIEECARWFEA